MPFTLTIALRNPKPGSEKFPFQIEVPDDEGPVTVADVKEAVWAKVKKLYPTRQRLVPSTDPKKALVDDKAALETYGVQNGDTLLLKDLGPQIAWRTVFLVEYLGPLIIHPLLFHLGPQVYGTSFAHSRMQKVTYGLVLMHNLKRELETLFVHRFSSSTMPLFNIFKNSAHYWILEGVLLAGAIYGPWNSAQKLAGTIWDDDKWLAGWIAVWAYAQLSNLHTHLALRNLRPPGTRVRKIPKGYGFSLVSCPNYFFETLAWVAVSALTGSWAAVLFTVVGAGQMLAWAAKKHRNYKKEFPNEYRKLHRKAMIPFIF